MFAILTVSVRIAKRGCFSWIQLINCQLYLDHAMVEDLWRNRMPGLDYWLPVPRSRSSGDQQLLPDQVRRCPRLTRNKVNQFLMLSICSIAEPPRRWRSSTPHPPWSIIISISAWWYSTVPAIRFWPICRQMTIVELYACSRMLSCPRIWLSISSEFNPIQIPFALLIAPYDLEQKTWPVPGERAGAIELLGWRGAARLAACHEHDCLWFVGHNQAVGDWEACRRFG